MNNASARAALTFAIGLGGGAVFWWLGLPLPWLLGALLATMGASMLGAPVEIRSGLRTYLVVVLGVMLGGTFTPQILDGAVAWLPTLAAAVGYLIVLTVVAQLYCRHIMKMDKITALFSGMPGGLSEMVVLGEERGADARALTLTHAIRVTAILVIIPLFLTIWFGTRAPVHLPHHATWSLPEVFVLLLSAIAGVLVGKVVRLPAYHLTGPLLVSAGVHLVGLVDGGRPAAVSLVIQVAMGSALGARFYGVRVKDVGRQMLLALGMVSVMLGVTFAFAEVLAVLTGFPFEALVLALSPGGIAEMALAALSMNIDPAFVTTHHGVRLLVVVFLSPTVLSFWIRRAERE